MAREKFSAIPESLDLTSVDTFIGIRDNGDDTFTNYRFTYAQIAALAQGAGKKRIEVTNSGDTLIDDFFSTNTISAIATQGQYYISDVDFTQDGDTITGVNISFFETQILIAFV